MKKLLALSIFAAISTAQADIIVTDVYLGSEFTEIQAQNPAGVFTTTNIAGAFVNEPAFIDNAQQDTFTVTDNNIGNGISFDVYERNYDTTNGLTAATLAELALSSNSNIAFEASLAAGNGTSQGTAKSNAFGFDTETTDSTGHGVLVFDFSNSTEAVKQFGVDVLDFEGGNTANAYVAVYDLNGDIIYNQSYSFDSDPVQGNSNGFGDDVVRFFGFEATGVDSIGAIAFFVGDDNNIGNGQTERIAAADFYIGIEENVSEVPVPTAVWLFGSALIGLASIQRRK